MLIATGSNGHMQASHLPVPPCFDGEGHLHRLRGHLARSYEQADDLIRIEAKFELNQNRSEADQQSVATALLASVRGEERQTGQLILDLMNEAEG